MSAFWTLLAMLLGAGGVDGRSAEEGTPPAEVVIHVTARRYEFQPSEIVVRRDVPVVLELASEDRRHGFGVPELRLRADIAPGAPAHVRFTPHKVGRFAFVCDVFCGKGHEEMTGEIVVTE